MKLDKLRLTDVLPYAEAQVDLAPAVTVFTGKSDSGKSCIIRALLQAFRNQPAGIDLLRHGAKRGACSEVEVVGQDTDGGGVFTIVRRRGKSKNEYEVDGKTVVGFGQEAPVEVTGRLNLSKHAFRLQQFGHFLLSERDGEVAKILSSTVGLAQIDAAFVEIRRRKTANDTDLRVAEADRLREQTASGRYEGVDRAKAIVDEWLAAVERADAISLSHQRAVVLRAALARLPAVATLALRRCSVLIQTLARACALVEETEGRAGCCDTILTMLRAVPYPVAIADAVAAVDALRAIDACRSEAQERYARANALYSMLCVVPPPTQIGWAIEAVDALRILSDGVVAIVEDAETARRINLALRNLGPSIPSLLVDRAKTMIRAATVATERAQIARLAVDEAGRLLDRLEVATRDLATSQADTCAAQDALATYMRANPVCSECGAAQEHWSVRALPSSYTANAGHEARRQQNKE